MSQLGQNAVRSHDGQMAFIDLADIPASGIVRKIFECCHCQKMGLTLPTPS